MKMGPACERENVPNNINLDPDQKGEQENPDHQQHPHRHLLEKKYNPGSMALLPAPEKVRVGALILGR